MKVMQKIARSILSEVDNLLRQKQQVLVAIDGRSAAGKTTLAALLHESNGCNVIHMDSFFLRPEQRTARRLEEPGGNIDRERFEEEVLTPLLRGEPFSYRPFDCKKQEMAPAIQVTPRPVTVVEGAYSCHPLLAPGYDLTVFLSIGKAEQSRRILDRNGELGLVIFAQKWIPLEERYFAAYEIRKRCSLSFDTDAMC